MIENKGDYYIRQQDLIHPDRLTMPVTLIGAGGIGSWTALFLAKMGVQQLMIIDSDIVESHNLGSQLFGISDIGQPKADAVTRRIKLLIDETKIQLQPTRYGVTSDNPIHIPEGSILISAVDNMETRKILFMESIRGTNAWFIDGRMGGNVISLYAFHGHDESACTEYAETIFSDDEADPTPCTERAVMYNVGVIAGLIADHVAHIANQEPVPFELTVDLRNYKLYGGFS